MTRTQSSLRLALPAAHPARIRALASAHGVGDFALGAFRYLELAADPYDALALAPRFPGAQFVAATRSDRRAAHAELVARCGVDNVRVASLDDLCGLAGRGPNPAPDTSGFDYVVAHGLYSWIAPDEQAKLLETVARALAPGGVALLSFNTLPGWSLRGSLRAQMLCAAPGEPIDKPSSERIYAARARLTKLMRNLPELGHPYYALLGSELQAAREAGEQALFEDLLAPHNEALHFGELARRAEAHGLAYVCESLPATPDGALELTAAPNLMAEGVGRIEAEECLDILCYRRLRASLFTTGGGPIGSHANRAGHRDLGHYAARLSLAEEPVLEASKAMAFVAPSGVRIQVEQPLLQAALLTLAEVHPAGRTAAALMSEAQEKLKLRGILDASLDAAEVGTVLDDLLQLVSRRQIELLPWEPPIARGLEGEPRLSALARLELEHGSIVTNARHEPTELDVLDATVARLCDGRRDFQALARAVVDRIDVGALQVDGLPDGAERLKAIAGLVLGSVMRLRNLGLFG